MDIEIEIEIEIWTGREIEIEIEIEMDACMDGWRIQIVSFQWMNGKMDMPPL